MRRVLLPALAIAVGVALPVAARPVAYVLEPAESVVGFETDFGPDLITGAMPVKSADLVIDFDRVENCRIAVALDVAGNSRP